MTHARCLRSEDTVRLHSRGQDVRDTRGRDARATPRATVARDAIATARCRRLGQLLTSARLRQNGILCGELPPGVPQV